MKTHATAYSIGTYLKETHAKGLKTGFVPTMGALHDGHLSLIELAKKEVDEVICSIFVNPLQFNRKEDLEKYPDRLKEDRKMLESVGCDLLFTPSYEEVYPNKPQLNFNFGSIGKGMEAEHRPNHFEGVAAVIKRFLEILSPTKAYFGEKDFQQLAIIKWLAREYHFNTAIVGCPTIRAKNGLAMSSRNYLLQKKDLEIAAKIYETLYYARNHIDNTEPSALSEECFSKLSEAGFKVEYFTIADENTMEPLKKWDRSTAARAFVAANLSGVRLIDNLSLNS